ncbi:MAG: WecB/TagA/CpsF family glycosyltransferase [Anaerolineae bacterium]|jgi:exopolysaccharide biosynthesis WecB/TagA/CpsF family protein|nr:WecB/TagA/CpsF family glycosyltransferase [Anaerolineae bacterium]
MTHRFLLVQPADLGDMIVTTPALAALRQAHPAAHLTLLAAERVAGVVEEGLVDEIIPLDRRGFNSTLAFLRPGNLRRLWRLRRPGYDTVIVFRHLTLRAGTLKFWLIAKASRATRVIGLDNGHGWFLTDRLPDGGFGAQHEAEYWLALAALAGAAPGPQRARVAFDRGPLPLAATLGMRVVIHAGSGGYSRARRWSPQFFARVADALVAQQGAQIVLVGAAEDDAAAVQQAMQQPALNLTGQTSLTGLADVLRSADVFIGADSGVMHLAAAVRTPVVAIFGPSNHAAWQPWSPGGRTRIVRSGPECSPCSYVGHGVGQRDGCAARTCMKLVTPEQVLRAVYEVLELPAPADLPPPPPAPPPPPRVRDVVHILGIPVDRITYSQWMDLVDTWVQHSPRCQHVCTTNPEFVVMAQRDASFRHILQRADLCIADGVGLLWAARLLGRPLPERVTGSDGTLIIAQEAARRGWKLFLLGAAPGVAETAAAVMREHLPGIQVVGTYPGSPAPEEEDALVERINASGAEIVLVAYGAPAQDKWIARNTPRLRVKMAMGVGGALDFIAGVVPRAPEAMRRYGLEWLYRLYKQPWRIVRMLRLPLFVVLVILRGEK